MCISSKICEFKRVKYCNTGIFVFLKDGSVPGYCNFHSHAPYVINVSKAGIESTHQPTTKVYRMSVYPAQNFVVKLMSRNMYGVMSDVSVVANSKAPETSENFHPLLNFETVAKGGLCCVISTCK